MKREWIVRHVLRIVVQIAFLALFGFVILQGRMQFWLGVFAASALLSVVFSRFYCGWICPMNTIFRPIAWLYGKLGLRRIRTPRLMTHPAVRIAFLILLIAGMLLTVRRGEKLPPLAILTGLSVLVVLFFEEALWHNAICPYGTILSLGSRPAVKRYAVAEETCNSCGKCQKVCPVHAIDTRQDGKRFIRKADCLVCGVCAESCPTNAIRYRTKRT